MNSLPPAGHENREKSVSVVACAAGESKRRQDMVVIEEPLEIRVVHGPHDARKMRSISITMRTPGHDDELAVGFLFTENVLSSPDQISGVQLRGVDGQGEPTGNIVRVELQPDAVLDVARLQRHFFTTSSCGVCGKASLEALHVQGLAPIALDGFQIASSSIRALPDRLRSLQSTFNRTGGLHAAGLVDVSGTVLESREDVGRHNAVDKLVGRGFLDGKTPLHKYAMIVSGRVSFEILQKALVAGIPMVIAVGAPSSLAVEMAEQFSLTLVGFTSSDRFNIYSEPRRIADVQ